MELREQSLGAGLCRVFPWRVDGGGIEGSGVQGLGRLLKALGLGQAVKDSKPRQGSIRKMPCARYWPDSALSTALFAPLKPWVLCSRCNCAARKLVL